MIYKGKEMSFLQLSQLVDIKPGTLQYRYTKLGLRDDDLLAGNGRTGVFVEHKGKLYTLLELADVVGINSSTICNRYRRGLRGDDLIEPVKVKHANNTTYYVKGEPYRLTTKEQRLKFKNKLSSIEIQNRLNLGLAMHEALKFSYKYVAKFGHMCYEIEGDEVFYYIPYDDVLVLNRHGIEMAQVSRNIVVVDDISQLLLDDTRVFEESADNDSSLNNELLERRKQESIQRYKDEKHREQKPHLYNGTKQSHSFGEYAQYLADSYTFACSDVKGEV